MTARRPCRGVILRKRFRFISCNRTASFPLFCNKCGFSWKSIDFLHRPLHNSVVPRQKEGDFPSLFLENVCVIGSLHISVYSVMAGPTSFSCGAGPPSSCFPVRGSPRACFSFPSL